MIGPMEVSSMNDSVTIRAAANGYIVSYWCWVNESQRELVYENWDDAKNFIESYFADASTKCEDELEAEESAE